MIVIIICNVDFFVGLVMGLIVFFIGWLFIDVFGILILFVVFVVVVFGGVFGLINGVFVVFVWVLVMVIIFGMLYVYCGINVLWMGSD